VSGSRGGVHSREKRRHQGSEQSCLREEKDHRGGRCKEEGGKRSSSEVVRGGKLLRITKGGEYRGYLTGQHLAAAEIAMNDDHERDSTSSKRFKYLHKGC